MTTIAELFLQEPIRIENGISMIVGTYYNHASDIEDYEIQAGKWEKNFALKIEQVLFHEAIEDYRRSWVLFGVRYDGRWVMLCSNAGRELDDYHKRQVVDAEAYKNMISYIRSELARIGKTQDVETVPMDTDVQFYFYGEDVRHGRIY